MRDGVGIVATADPQSMSAHQFHFDHARRLNGRRCRRRLRNDLDRQKAPSSSSDMSAANFGSFIQLNIWLAFTS